MTSLAFDASLHTILIVDDDPNNLRVTAEYLETIGFQVVVSRDGESGLDRAKFVQPDLILLDVMMPGWDGFETCRRLKNNRETRDIPVIFMTALENPADKVTGFEVGGVDYVTKPMHTEELLARIKTHLTIQRLTSQLRDANETLSSRVEERTAALRKSNQELQAEIIERQQVETEIQHRNQELALLNRVIDTSVRETEVETILELTCQELARTFRLPRATIWLLNEDKTEVELVAIHLAENGQVAKEIQTALVADVLFIEQNISQTMPQVIADATASPHLPPIFNLDEGVSTISMLTVPLIIDERVIGGVVLEAYEKYQFSQDQVDLAQSVSSQVAGVLERRQLDEERQQLQAQYYQAQKMDAIGHLAGGIAHDFNNILVPIIGYAELGKRGLTPDDYLYRSLQEIEEAAGRAANLTRQILAFSRKQVLEVRVVDLNSIVLDFQSMVHRLIGEDITLQTFLDSEVCRVRADKGQLEQVLLNLVVNARDAMPNGGKLTIETANTYLDDAYIKRYQIVEPTGHYAMLAVSDSGHGMDAETQKQIFEPFFTTKPQGEGTGLGLATVFGIVKQHSGNIWVYSELGKGATFKIYLPRAEGATQPSDEMSAANLSSVTGTETVLVVEDEALVRKLVCETLLAQGYTVLEAAGPNEAIDLVANYDKPIQLLLTDVIMPDMNGRQLYDALSSDYPTLAVLYMSGYTDNVIVHHGILDEGIHFLQKPFTILELTQKVRIALS